MFTAELMLPVTMSRLQSPLKSASATEFGPARVVVDGGGEGAVAAVQQHLGAAVVVTRSMRPSPFRSPAARPLL